MNPAIRMLLIMEPTGFSNIPPAGKSFWITNVGQYMSSNSGQRIIFNQGQLGGRRNGKRRNVK